jgi:hypothetical protein
LLIDVRIGARRLVLSRCSDELVFKLAFKVVSALPILDGF